VLASAVRSREEAASISRPVAAFVVLVWLKLAGEAAFGDQRPVFDRQKTAPVGTTIAVIEPLAGHRPS